MSMRTLILELKEASGEAILRAIKSGKLKKINSREHDGASVYRMMLRGVITGKQKPKGPHGAFDMYDLAVA